MADAALRALERERERQGLPPLVEVGGGDMEALAAALAGLLSREQALDLAAALLEALRAPSVRAASMAEPAWVAVLEEDRNGRPRCVVRRLAPPEAMHGAADQFGGSDYP